jgi:hypothetical protein
VGEDDPVTLLTLEWISTVIKGCYYSQVAFSKDLSKGMDELCFSLGVARESPTTITYLEMDMLDMILEMEIEDRLPLDVITVEDRRRREDYDDSTTYSIKKYGLSLQKIVQIVEKRGKATIRDVGYWGSSQYASYDRLIIH